MRHIALALALIIFVSACIQQKTSGSTTTSTVLQDKNKVATQIGYCSENKTYAACKSNFPESKYLEPNLGILSVVENWYEGETKAKNLSYITWTQYHPGPPFIGWYILANGTEIRTWKDFKRFFAPVEDENEAVAFAVLIASYSNPVYKEEDFFKGEILVASNVTLTHAEKTSDGYLVNLFENGGYCYPHSEEIKYLVRENGDVEMFDSRIIYNMTEPRCVN